MERYGMIIEGSGFTLSFLSAAIPIPIVSYLQQLSTRLSITYFHPYEKKTVFLSPGLAFTYRQTGYRYHHSIILCKILILSHVKLFAFLNL